jgi:uncharacterized membrane protein
LNPPLLVYDCAARWVILSDTQGGDIVLELTKETDSPCSLGMPQKIAALLAYLLAWVGGLIFYFGEKDNRFVRFCAMQSLMVNAALITATVLLTILSRIDAIGVVFFVLNVLVTVAAVAAMVFLGVQGYRGYSVRLPFVGELAEQWSAID